MRTRGVISRIGIWDVLKSRRGEGIHGWIVGTRQCLEMECQFIPSRRNIVIAT
jgi:hypothetical protein